MTLKEWLASMDEDEDDLNSNLLRLFQMAGMSGDGSEVQIIMTSYSAIQHPSIERDKDILTILPVEDGWWAAVDSDDAQAAALYFDRVLIAYWSFASQGSWASEGWVRGKWYHSMQTEPEWEAA